MTYSDIIGTFRDMATDADTLHLSDITLRGRPGIGNEIDSSCSGESCTATIANIGTLTFSLDEIYDPSLIGDSGFEGYNVGSQALMVDGDATLVQGRGAARQNDGTTLEFQSFAGWIDGSVFGINAIEVTESASSTTYFTGYSFGNASGTNPSGTGRSVWNGVFIGINRASSSHAGAPVHGDVTIDIDDLANPDVDFTISSVGRINDMATSRVSYNYNDMPLRNGIFEEENGQVKGSFYGDNHEEVGGFLQDINHFGAFGATRQ